MMRTTIMDPAIKKPGENSAVSADTLGTSRTIPATQTTIDEIDREFRGATPVNGGRAL